MKGGDRSSRPCGESHALGGCRPSVCASRTVEEALAFLDYHLDRVFPPEKRTPARPADDEKKPDAKNVRTRRTIGE
jgi:hypothetical protein